MTSPVSRSPRVVNYWAALILMVGLVLLGVSIHFLHSFQVKRNAHELLEEATRAEEQGQLWQALDYLSQYVALIPRDTDARARLGLLLDRYAQTPGGSAADQKQALYLLEQVLQENPDRADVRRRVVELAFARGRYALARESIQILLEEQGPDADLLLLQARCEIAERRLNDAEAHLEEVLPKFPDNIPLHVEYALLLREHRHDPSGADRVMSRLLEKHPRALAVHLALAHYYLRFGQPAQAAEHIQFARQELKSPGPDLALLAAEAAQMQGNIDQARRELETVLDKGPPSLRLVLQLARLEAYQGQADKAVQRLRPYLKSLPRTTEELWQLGGILADARQRAEVKAVIEQLEAIGAAAPAGCLKAHLLLEEGQAAEARALLGKVRPATLESSAVRSALDLLLAQCHARLHNPDQQVLACRSVLAASPSSLEARRLLASGLAATGKTNAAADEYRKVLDQSSVLQGARLQAAQELASLLLAGNLAETPKQRRQELQGLVSRLESSKTTARAGRLLQARVWLLAGKAEVEQARELLEKLRDEGPTDVEPWRLLAIMAEKQGKKDAILPLLERAEGQTGKRVEWELARARYWAKTSPEQARRELERIHQRLPQLAESDRPRLLHALIAAFTASGNEQAVEQLWQQLAEQSGDDLELHLALFEHRLKKKQYSAAQLVVGEIHRIEGDGGALTPYCRAILLQAQTDSADGGSASEAQQLLAEAAALRPSSASIPLLQAQLFEKQDLPDKALEKYQQAVDLGEGSVPVIRRMVQLLVQQGRAAEATALLQKQPEPALASPELGRLAAELALAVPEEGSSAAREQARKRAFERAQTAVDKSQDYRDHLWLGRMAALAGQPSEARQAYTKARDLARTAPETWQALILFLARTDARQAEKELAEAQKALAGQNADRELSLCFEALGHNEQAEQRYLAVLDRRPRDADTLRLLAAFYARTGQRSRIEPILRRLIDPATQAPQATAAWARRTLALELAGGGSYPAFEEALALLEKAGDEQADSSEDRYARALVLATQPAHRREAIRLLERTPAPPGASAAASLRLAQLYEQDGNWRRARELMLSLLADNRKDPTYLASYIRGLLSHGEPQEAQTWLEALPAQGLSGAAMVDLHVRVLQANGKKEEALRRVREYARKDAQPILAGQLLELLGESKEAEQLYRRLAATEAPAGMVGLMELLCSQERASEALELNDQAWKRCPPEVGARLSLSVLRMKQLGDAQRRHVVEAIRSAAKAHPQSLFLQISLASASELCGRDEDAVSVYRQVLDKAPSNVLVLNNLAYQLAQQRGAHDEAQGLIDKAIQLAGPQAELLDTRAWVHLQAERPEAATRDLEQAIAQAPRPMYQFHLALAHHLAGDEQRARQTYEQACAAGLKADIVPPAEKIAWAKLKEALGKESASEPARQ